MLSSLVMPTISRAKYLLVDNSTVILTGVGVVGTVGTAVLAGRASFKAAEIIRKKEQELPAVKEEMSKTEKFQATWHLYIPSVALGTATVASIVTANRISSRKIAALAVATGLSERALQEYKDKIAEKLGDKQATAIRDEIAQDRVNAHPSSQVHIFGAGEVLFFDPLTGRYFKSTVEDVKRAINRVNKDIIRYDNASLSLFYEEIGLPPTTYSDLAGWNTYTFPDIEFSTVMSEDNQPCIAIEFTRMPSLEYDKQEAGAG